MNHRPHYLRRSYCPTLYAPFEADKLAILDLEPGEEYVRECEGELRWGMVVRRLRELLFHLQDTGSLNVGEYRVSPVEVDGRKAVRVRRIGKVI